MTDNTDASRSTIMKEIKETEDNIKSYFERVNIIKKKLKANYILEDQRNILEKELTDVEQLLQKSKTDLNKLHKENSKVFAFAVMLMFFSFLIFGLYRMIFGHT